jgi:RNA polymerase sigma-70 factor (ECF subfamily)
MDDSTEQDPIQDERAELQHIEHATNKRWRSYLDRVARQEPQALADLYDESSALIFGIASLILGNPADAEEITLDVYTDVWRSTVQFDSSRATVVTWLVMLTRSRAIDRLRSTTSRIDQGETNRALNLVDTPVALSRDNSSRIFVARAREQLECADRELLDLVLYSGLSHSELAARLGTPLGTLNTHVRAALSRLRTLMERPDVSS